MSLQSDLLRNKYAQIALNLPQKYKLSASELHSCSQYLFDLEIEKGNLNKDHLIQFAVNWAKNKESKSLDLYFSVLQKGLNEFRV